MSSKSPTEFLNAIHTPIFTSPVDGKDYSVTNGAIEVAGLHGMLLDGLRRQSPTAFVKAQAIMDSARKVTKDQGAAIRDALLAQARIAFELLKEGESEQKHIRAARHMLSDVLGLLDEPAHVAYRASKYKNGEKATDADRVEATLTAYARLLELTFVPGLV